LEISQEIKAAEARAEEEAREDAVTADEDWNAEAL
jgi:hypothetical protein